MITHELHAAIALADPVVVENVQYTHAGEAHPVLRDVSLCVPAGELVVVAGAPGSGKSTLLGLVGGWRAPQGGRVRVLGTELAGAPARVRREVRRRLAFVAQSAVVVQPSSVADEVMLALVLAFAAAPPLLVADDPTATMRDPLRARVGVLLRQFARESNAAVLVASEDPAILAVADRVLRLEQGTLAGLAEPERTTIVYRQSA